MCQRETKACVVAGLHGCGRGADYLEETSSVCVGEGCESERKRELATEGDIEEERGREGSFVSINGV